jgi:hypothetical protein
MKRWLPPDSGYQRTGAWVLLPPTNFILGYSALNKNVYLELDWVQGRVWKHSHSIVQIEWLEYPNLEVAPAFDLDGLRGMPPRYDLNDCSARPYR